MVFFATKSIVSIIGSLRGRFGEPLIMKSRRAVYALSAFATICLGLLWRSSFLSLIDWQKKYGGVALWACVVYFSIRFAAPSLSCRRSATIALVISFGVEFSQLLRATWLDAFRATRIGHLILGSTFNWPDLAAYALGICAAFLLDAWGIARTNRQRRT
jgi:hypothetical protein